MWRGIVVQPVNVCVSVCNVQATAAAATAAATSAAFNHFRGMWIYILSARSWSWSAFGHRSRWFGRIDSSRRRPGRRRHYGRATDVILCLAIFSGSFGCLVEFRTHTAQNAYLAIEIRYSLTHAYTHRRNWWSSIPLKIFLEAFYRSERTVKNVTALSFAGHKKKNTPSFVTQTKKNDV